MFKTLILILVFIFLISPMLSLIHELSHALLPLTKGEEVIVKVGVNPVVDFKIKNFSLKIGFLKPWLGFTSWSGENTIGRLLLGPLASLILAISFYFLSQTNIEYKSVIIDLCGGVLFSFYSLYGR